MALTTTSTSTRFSTRQRRALVSEVEHHRERAAHLRADAASLLEDDHVTITSFDSEGADADTSFVDRDQLLSLATREDEAADEAERALHRLDAGTYEECESCGGRIGQARLSAMPSTTVCVSCKAGSIFS
ncbi:MAG TPA: TraR/DksA C4-type zinc finger protein [Acidimicrobiales bacterium]|nr:TraR/DksA C4-type zinc finger protein [Acidimicrobiales bacterium]